MDDLLGTILELLGPREHFVIILGNLPTRLSTKFLAIGRGHGVSIELASGSKAWTITKAAA